jgi:hypothetical protein
VSILPNWWWAWGWGWAWWVVHQENMLIEKWEYSVTIWAKWRWDEWYNWGSSCFNGLVAYWWWRWASPSYAAWSLWASWWGGYARWNYKSWWAW